MDHQDRRPGVRRVGFLGEPLAVRHPGRERQDAGERRVVAQAEVHRDGTALAESGEHDAAGVDAAFDLSRDEPTHALRGASQTDLVVTHRIESPDVVPGRHHHPEVQRHGDRRRVREHEPNAVTRSESEVGDDGHEIVSVGTEAMQPDDGRVRLAGRLDLHAGEQRVVVHRGARYRRRTTSIRSGRMDPRYTSALNRDVPPARAGEFAPLRIGAIAIDPPVVLAPMAGVTNYPFRAVCRRFGAAHYISEMISARGLVEDHPGTLRLAEFGPDEHPRALQLYGTDPAVLGIATRRLVDEGRVDHIDLNFGCPVRKVTSKGGGSAIPAHPRLLERLVRAVVGAAGEVPVTIKVRIGLNDDVITFEDSGRIAEGEGCAAIGLHARTAADLYDGEARWDAIGRLKALVRIPVLGNGDIWEAEDALRMMRATGCDGVIVGRGCLGRPWLFRDLADRFAGREARDPPNLGEIVDTMRDHARRLAAWFGEARGILSMRRFGAWYTKSFPGSGELRERLVRIRSLADLDAALEGLDRDEPFPIAAMRVRRGKSSGRQTVALPDGWLARRDDASSPGREAEECVSGG